MKRAVWFFALLISTGARAASEKPCSSPMWTEDLSAKYQFRLFDLAKHPRNQPPSPWKESQEVAFTSPAVLAIYQVQETEENPSLQQRDASGGGGKYLLKIVFLDTATGKEQHTLQLTTTGLNVSGIYPTHDGRFVVVTGQLLRLYSPTFEEVRSRPFPLSPYGKPESWRISVIPGGKSIYISAAEHYLLDSDTLQIIWNPRPSDFAYSAKGRDFFRNVAGPTGGVFNSEGQWMPIDLNSNYQNRVLWTFLDVPYKDSGGWAPKELRVFSTSGQLTWSLSTHDKFSSFSSNGALLAAAVYKDGANPFDLDLAPKPVRIEIYNLHEKLEKCTIRITRPAYYDLSPKRDLAVVQGNILSLYHLEPD